MTQTVRVPLASSVLYVSGTVNGVDKIWTREEGSWWSTTADRANDGVYRVALSIVYGDGKTASDSVTLYYGLMLITDRTQKDVDRVKYLTSLWGEDGWTGTDEELEEYRGELKGRYTDSDLNRVGAAMAYLRDRFNANGYEIQIDPKTTWREIDVHTDPDMTLFLGYLGTLKSAITLPVYTPEAPTSMENLTYSKANDIETILEIIDAMITLTVNAYWYSGELYSGEAV